jgi:hypothetical protein
MPEWPKGPGCKPGAFSLRRFESFSLHTWVPRPGEARTIPLRARGRAARPLALRGSWGPGRGEKPRPPHCVRPLASLRARGACGGLHYARGGALRGRWPCGGLGVPVAAKPRPPRCVRPLASLRARGACGGLGAVAGLVRFFFCGSSSVGRAPAFQAGCREFESRLPLSPT